MDVDLERQPRRRESPSSSSPQKPEGSRGPLPSNGPDGGLRHSGLLTGPLPTDGLHQFHDEIRRLGPDLLIGKYMMRARGTRRGAAGRLARSCSMWRAIRRSGRFGFYYLLTRAGEKFPANPLLEPFLDTRSPDGVGHDLRRRRWSAGIAGTDKAGSVDARGLGRAPASNSA